jgi:hypothetical protein
MKRMHIHLAVADLSKSIRFSSALFAAEPSVSTHQKLGERLSLSSSCVLPETTPRGVARLPTTLMLQLLLT